MAYQGYIDPFDPSTWYPGYTLNTPPAGNSTPPVDPTSPWVADPGPSTNNGPGYGPPPPPASTPPPGITQTNPMSGSPGIQQTNNTIPPPQSGAPSYVNQGDPVHAAVWAAYQKKGIQPRDQSDFTYWVDKINADRVNMNSYWIPRMNQSSGGVGDYSTGGGGGGSSAPGTGFTGMNPGFTGGAGGSFASMYGINIPQAPPALNSATTINSPSAPTPSALNTTVNTPVAPTVPQINVTVPATLPFQQRGDELYQKLMGRADQSLQVNPEDPIIANQVNAFKGQEQSGVRNYLNQLAEAQGPIGNLNQERRAANQAATQATGTMQASLIQNELVARRSEIAQALQQMGSLLTAEQQMRLQQELSHLDLALRQNQMGLQNSQFYAGLGQQGQIASIQAALQQAGMNNQQGQYYAGLGQQGQIASLDALLRQAAMNNQNNQYYAGLNLQGQGMGMSYDQFLRQLGLNAQQQSWYQDAVNKGLV